MWWFCFAVGGNVFLSVLGGVIPPRCANYSNKLSVFLNSSIHHAHNFALSLSSHTTPPPSFLSLFTVRNLIILPFLFGLRRVLQHHLFVDTFHFTKKWENLFWRPDLCSFWQINLSQFKEFYSQWHLKVKFSSKNWVFLLFYFNCVLTLSCQVFHHL